jgi:hypothetical protein
MGVKLGLSARWLIRDWESVSSVKRVFWPKNNKYQKGGKKFLPRNFVIFRLTLHLAHVGLYGAWEMGANNSTEELEKGAYMQEW